MFGLRLALGVGSNWLLGGDSGSGSGAESFLLDESNAPLLTETASELLLETQ